MQCNSCRVLYINGIRCHEHGCPDAWLDQTRECSECGCDFAPETRYQTVCDECGNAESIDPHYWDDQTSMQDVDADMERMMMHY